MTGEDSANDRQKDEAVAAPEKVYPDCNDRTVLLTELEDVGPFWLGPMFSGHQAIYILKTHHNLPPSILVIDKLGVPMDAEERILDEELDGPICLAVGEESIFIGASENVYRMPIAGGPLERIYQGDVPPETDSRESSCDLEILEGRLFYRDPFRELWSIEEGKVRFIAEDVRQFTTNDERLFWATEDGVIFSSDVTGDSIQELTQIEGSLVHASEDQLYYRGSGSRVFRVSMDGGDIHLALETIDEEEGGDVRSIVFFEDEFYLSSDRGELLRASLGDELPATYEIKEERGSFDDDDFSSAMAVDEVAVYWLSGPTLGVRSSDNDPVALWATCH